MPTEKPKITAYLNPTLYRWLQNYQKSRGLKSLSKAIEQALEEYSEMLAVREEEESRETVAEVQRELEQIRREFNQRIEELAQKLAQLDEGLEKEEL